MRLVAVIVAFNPQAEHLRRNIEACIIDVDELIVWFNSEIDDYVQQEIDMFARLYANLITIYSETNLGIAGAVNKVVALAKEKEYTHLLTLDQDSYFRQGDLGKFKRDIMIYDGCVLDIHCPNPFANSNYSYPVGKPLLDVEDAITSGTILNLGLFDLIGEFDQYLMIDAVDYDYCYRANLHNIKTLVHTEIHLNQEFGYQTKSIWGFYTLNYSPFRSYTIVRNHIIVWKRYPQLFKSQYKVRLLKDFIFFRLVKVIFGETDKVKKIKAIFLAIYDGVFDRSERLGKLIQKSRNL